MDAELCGRSPAYDVFAQRQSACSAREKTRNGLTVKDLTEQLRIDTERYRTKSRCTSLLCFIYDPEGRIGNPRALETSLTTVSESLTIDVLVAPK